MRAQDRWGAGWMEEGGGAWVRGRVGVNHVQQCSAAWEGLFVGVPADAELSRRTSMRVESAVQQSQRFGGRRQGASVELRCAV